MQSRSIIHYLFRVRTLAPIGGSALSGWLALSQINKQVYDVDLWLYGIIGIFFGLASWISIARDDLENESDKNDLRLIIKDMKVLIPSIEIPISAQGMDDWNNEHLVQEILKYIGKLQTIQNERTSAENDRQTGAWTKYITGDPRGDKIFADEIAIRDHIRNESDKKFRTAVPDGIALLEQLKSRIGSNRVPRHEEREYFIALEVGHLIGPNPIGQIELGFMRLMRELPHG